MLIAKVNIMAAIHVRAGATRFKGHTIAFPQDIQAICNILPRRLCDLPVLIVYKIGKSGNRHDYRVRRDVVRRSR